MPPQFAHRSLKSGCWIPLIGGEGVLGRIRARTTTTAGRSSAENENPSPTALLNHSNSPRGQSDGAVLRNRFAGKQVLSLRECIGDLGRSSRIVQDVVNRVPIRKACRSA